MIQLGYFTIDTPDLEKARAFYGSLFGWTFDDAASGPAYLIIYSLVGGPHGQLRILRIYHTAQDWTGWSAEPDEEV